MQESLTLTGAASRDFDKYHFVAARIARRFASADGSLRLSSSRAQFNVDRDYSAEKLRAQLQLPLVDDGVWRISPLTGVGIHNSEERDREGQLNRETDTRTLEAGIAGQRTVGAGLTEMRATYVKGLDILDARSFSSQQQVSDLNFGIAVFSLMHLHAIAPGWQIRADVDAQWSAANLPVGERFTSAAQLSVVPSSLRRWLLTAVWQ